MLGTAENLVVAQPNQAPAQSGNDLARRLVRLDGDFDQVLAIGVIAFQAQDERHGPHLTLARASYQPALNKRLKDDLPTPSVVRGLLGERPLT
jgi:hypothetical protein